MADVLAAETFAVVDIVILFAVRVHGTRMFKDDKQQVSADADNSRV